MANTLGEVLLLRGKRASAESAFVRAGAEPAQDILTAALNRAWLHFDRGERARAMKESLRQIHRYLQRVGRQRSLERRPRPPLQPQWNIFGANDPQLFKDALKAYDRAVTSDPIQRR